MTGRPALPDDYGELLEHLKAEIAGARTRAALAVNEELIGLYWRIGREILERRGREGWGTRVTKRLSADLRDEFPDMSGLSEANLRHMRAFAQAWPELAVCSRAVSKLPWGHNLQLVYKLDDPAVRIWYAEAAVGHGWSRALLEHHIATHLHEREGRALTNFAHTLPSPESELVQQIVHEEYNFEFLGLGADVREAELERSLIEEIERFMLELGAGFAFVGRQVPLDVNGEEFHVDLLFFHIPLNRYVVIELKLGKFRPEHAGQINFYVNVVDHQLREAHHDSTIGLLLCASRSDIVVRYALDGIARPVGVARYRVAPTLADKVPEELHDQLPELERISAGVKRIVARHVGELDRTERDQGS